MSALRDCPLGKVAALMFAMTSQARATLSTASAAGVVWCERVALSAMGFPGVSRGRTHAATDIFSERNHLQVSRINTHPNSAEMVELKTARDFPNQQFICESMCMDISPTPQRELPIASGGRSALPDPAVARIVHFSPKALRRCGLIPSVKIAVHRVTSGVMRQGVLAPLPPSILQRVVS